MLVDKVPADLKEHHRRCALPLARLRHAAMAEGMPYGTPDLFGQITEAMAEVMAELGEASETILVGDRVSRSRRRSVSAFLGARLARLRAAAVDTEVAARRGDLPALRRGALTFHALASAMRKVQIAVREPERPRTGPAERRRPPHGRTARNG